MGEDERRWKAKAKLEFGAFAMASSPNPSIAWEKPLNPHSHLPFLCLVCMIELIVSCNNVLPLFFFVWFLVFLFNEHFVHLIVHLFRVLETYIQLFSLKKSPGSYIGLLGFSGVWALYRKATFILFVFLVICSLDWCCYCISCCPSPSYGNCLFRCTSVPAWMLVVKLLKLVSVKN